MVKEAARQDVQRLMDEGAQIVEVLPRTEYDDAHLPGAIHIPLQDLPDKAASQLDPKRPVVVYCYDSLCDMSPRAAWRLHSLGFSDVYDYVASKVDWIGAGLPFEGERAEGPQLARLADRGVPTCRPEERVGEVRPRLGEWELCLVVNEQQVVLGLVRAEALGMEDDRPVSEVMQESPRTYRPHMTPAELERHLDKTAEPWLLVTNLDGTLVGIVRPDDVRASLRKDVDG
jgi:rhodanese-related sulfurtransferase